MESPIEQRPPAIPQEFQPVEMPVERPGPRRRRRIRFWPWFTSPRLGNYWIAITIVLLIIGSLSGYQIGLNQGMHAAKSVSASSTVSPTSPSGNDMMTKVNPPEGYKILAKLGQIGPKLLAAGAIDLNKLLQVYAQSGRTLPKDQSDLLNDGSDADLIINAQNADFGRIDARQLVSNRYSSGSGFQFVHQFLVKNNLLEQAPNSNGSSAVQ